MSDATNSARVNVYINGQSGIAEIDKLERKMVKLGKEINRVGKDSDLGRKMAAEMHQAQAEIDKLAKKLDLTKMSIRQLESESRRLRRLRDMAEPGTAEFKKLNRELALVSARMKAVQTGLGPFGQAWKLVWDQMKGFNLAVMGLLAGGVAISFFKDIIRGASDLSDQMADVRKTTGMTKDEVKALNSELSKIDTRTSKKELRDMAIVAGQLGIAKNDIAGFVKSVDTINVALGDEFTGGAQQVAEEMGKLRNIFTDVKSDRIDQDMLRIGNAFNVLAAEGAATGPVIAENANRIGGYGIQVGLTTGQVIGLSAAQQELNIASERGSTAIVRILQKMLQNVDTFAEVAGMQVGEFKTMLDTDLFGAFMKVVEGSRKAGSSNTKLAAIIDELEVSGAGASEVFAKFGANVELIKSKADLATKSLGGTQSIMDEFRLKNENAAAAAEKIGKAISGWFTSTFMEPAEKFLVWLGKATGLIKSLSTSLEEERTQLVMTEIKLKDVNTKQEDRVRIIRDLQTKYPTYLGNLDAETVKNEQLFEAIRKTNMELVNRIIIAKKQEEIDTQSERTADRVESRLKREDALARKMSQLVKEDSSLKISGGTLKDQAQSLLDQLRSKGKANLSILSDYGSLSNALRSYSDALALEASEVQRGNKILNEREALMKRLGITTEETVQKQVEVVSPTINTTPTEATGQASKSDSKGKAAEPFKFDQSKLNQYRKQIEAFYVEVGNLYKSDTELAIFEATRKYDELLEANALAQQELMAQIWLGDAAERKAAQQQLNQLLRDEEALHEQRARRAAEAERKVAEERLAARKQAEKMIADAVRTPQEAEIARVMEHYQTLIDLAKQYGIDATAVVEAREKAIKAITDKYRTEDEAANKARLDRISTAVGEYTNAAMSLITPIVTAIKNSAEKQILESERIAEKRMQNLEKSRENGLITEKQYQDRKLAMEKKQAKEIGAIRRRQIIADRIAATAQVVFSTAQAIMKAVAANPETGGLPWSAIAGAVGAAQTYAIWSEPIPEYKRGLGGIPGGPSHENGGLDIVNSQTGRKVGEMEGGEPYMILSKSTYGNNGALIDKLLRASLYENGRRLTAEEILASTPSMTMPRNLPSATGSVFRSGGVTGRSRSSRNANIDLQRLANAISRLEEAASRPLKATVVYRDLQETEDEESKIRAFANIGSSKTKSTVVKSSSSSSSTTTVQSTTPGPAGPAGQNGAGLELYYFYSR